MDKSKYELLTTNELLFTLIGCIIGAGILSLPNSAVAFAKQDGWIATFMAGIYPLYVVLIGGIIIRKFPDNDIMDVSKMYLGNFFGAFLNLLFMAQFMLYIINALNASANVLRVYAVWFMTPFKISLILVILVVYTCSQGLKTIAKINVLMFFIILLLTMFSFMAFRHGSILNVQPVFDTDWDKMFKAGLETLLSYGNMELLLIIHPYIENKGVIIKTALIATGIITLFYTWTVFSTIFFLGPDIVTKSLWPFFFVTASIKIPVITSFRFIYMALWTLIIFKTAATEYYASTAIFKNTFKKINWKYICIFLSPVLLLSPFLFENEVARRAFISKIMPWITLFNIAYITLIALLTALKKRNFN